MTKEKSIVIRITESSQKLMTSMNKGSVDAGIKFLWAKVCTQGKEINALKAQIKDLNHVIDESIETINPKSIISAEVEFLALDEVEGGCSLYKAVNIARKKE